MSEVNFLKQYAGLRLEPSLREQRDTLQQRLAEADKLLREARKYCDWSRHPLPQAIDTFLASSGCADGEKP